MTDNLKIDSHKLIYHVSRVNQWLNGEDIYPIYIEIGPSGGCNHRCSFCALDYLEYKPNFIDKDRLMQTLAETARYGVKSVMFAGEGEPLLHKDISELVLHTKKNNIDVAITTNGVFFDVALAKEILGALTWIRISLNAGTSATYSKIHRCNIKDFDTVLNNLANAVRIKRQNNYLTTIGVQLLLLPENYNEATTLAKRLKEIGVDYLTIKPYSQHPMSANRLKEDIDYSNFQHLEDELDKFADNSFKILFRTNTIKKLREPKPYQRCLGLSFWAYIDSGGNMYACSAFLGDKDFCYGNIYNQSFKEIWESEKRKKILKRFQTELDANLYCREVCRLDEINRYLWALKHPQPHVNFI